jgi:hypothetical protein
VFLFVKKFLPIADTTRMPKGTSNQAPSSPSELFLVIIAKSIINIGPNSEIANIYSSGTRLGFDSGAVSLFVESELVGVITLDPSTTTHISFRLFISNCFF